MKNFEMVLLMVTAVILGWLVSAGCAKMQMRAGVSAVPKDAIVLFNGTDFSQWTGESMNPVQWRIVGDAMEVLPGSGSIMTKREFQDCKLHLEFSVPEMSPGPEGQERGNSGVYIQRRYEIQILNSYGLGLSDSGCGAIYRVKPPDENVCKKAGKWQSYDIIFHAPLFEAGGAEIKKVKNARITVLHNGVLVHNDVEIPSKTGRGQPEGPQPAPILLQDHGSKVKFRNIWAVQLDGAS